MNAFWWHTQFLYLAVNEYGVNSCLCWVQEESMEMAPRGSLQRLRYSSLFSVLHLSLKYDVLTVCGKNDCNRRTVCHRCTSLLCCCCCAPWSLFSPCFQCFQSDPHFSSQSVAWPHIGGEHLFDNIIIIRGSLRYSSRFQTEVPEWSSIFPLFFCSGFTRRTAGSRLTPPRVLPEGPGR